MIDKEEMQREREKIYIDGMVWSLPCVMLLCAQGCAGGMIELIPIKVLYTSLTAHFKLSLPFFLSLTKYINESIKSFISYHNLI